tara:strand:- start:6742 stop:6993 length:252 start_codon:yes stop_codon:yes gene_type:complete
LLLQQARRVDQMPVNINVAGSQGVAMRWDGRIAGAACEGGRFKWNSLRCGFGDLSKGHLMFGFPKHPMPIDCSDLCDQAALMA